MDKRIFMIFLSLILLAGFIFLFRYVTKPVFHLDVNYSPISLIVGQEITFNNTIVNEKEPVWDFGDGNKRTGNTVKYTFDSKGDKNIKIAIGEDCKLDTTIHVSDSVIIVDTVVDQDTTDSNHNNVKLVADFYPRTIRVGKRVTFFDKTRGATKWEWRIDGAASAQTKQYTTSFNREAKYKVALHVEGKNINLDTSFAISVLPIPGGGSGDAGYNCVSGSCGYVRSNADYASLAACQSACGGVDFSAFKDDFLKYSDKKNRTGEEWRDKITNMCDKTATIYFQMENGEKVPPISLQEFNKQQIGTNPNYTVESVVDVKPAKNGEKKINSITIKAKKNK